MDCDSWTAGESVYVDIYSNQPKVELFLNSTSLGASSTKDATYKFIYTVAYVEGTLSCAAYGDDGSVTATDVVKTSLKTVQKISLETSIDAMGVDSKDYAVVFATLQDANGVLVARADDNVAFECIGGTMLGTDNGYTKDGTKMTSPSRHAFCGKVACIVKPDKTAGSMMVTARLADKASVSGSISIAKPDSMRKQDA